MNKLNFKSSIIQGRGLEKCRSMIQDRIAKLQRIHSALKLISEVNKHPKKNKKLLDGLPMSLWYLSTLTKKSHQNAVCTLINNIDSQILDLVDLSQKLENGKFRNRSEFSDAVEDIVSPYSVIIETLLPKH